MLKMHGEKRAWSLLSCTCELIMPLLKRERKTQTARVERRRVAQKFKRRCRGTRRARLPASARATALLNYIEMS